MKEPGTDTDPAAPSHLRRKRMLGAIAIVAVALSAGAYLTVLAITEAHDQAAGAGASNGAAPGSASPRPGASAAPTRPPEPASSEAPEPNAEPDPPAQPVPEEISAAATKFLDATVTVDPAAADPRPGLGDAASGAILAELENDTQELESNGWTREGSATIDGLTLVTSDAAAEPATVVIEACVDSSAVRTLDHSGNPVGDSGSTVQRALNIYTLAYIDDVWKVVARTFPDNPAC